MFSPKKSYIKTVRIPGAKPVSIPIAEIDDKTHEKTIVITAGMDGDEYSGIEAAYQLIEQYNAHPINARLVIFPITNMPGFESYMSKNPTDNKFPKYVFPGNEHGTQTEQLINWLYKNYLNKSALWLDLHAGAITEQLNPFVSFYQTTSDQLNKTTQTIIAALDADIITYENPTWAKNKFDLLTKNNTIYILLESGQAGERNNQDIQRHITWVQTMIHTFLNTPKINQTKTVYTDMDIYYAKEKGLWYSTIEKEQPIKKGMVLGTLTDLQGKEIQTLIASADGIFLWGKQALMAHKGDELVALGTLPKKML